MQIWDTAGQERFRTITSSYYRGAHGIIVVYDVTDRESFKNVENWMKEIRQYAPPEVSIVLVANKIDMESSRVISYDEGKEYADRLGVKFLETSAKTSHNTEEALISIAYDIKYKQELAAQSTNSPPGDERDQSDYPKR